MELYKVGGAFCAALLVLLGLNFVSEDWLFSTVKGHGDDNHLAFSVEIEGADDDGGEVEAVNFGVIFASADAAAGEKVFKKCKSCHKIEDGANGVGPHLWGIVDRGIAAVDSYGSYSGALPAGEVWTPENLYAFLEAPKKWAKGTSMGFNGLKKSQDRADLIAYLNQADGTPEPLPSQ
jgi:cytochrome c